MTNGETDAGKGGHGNAVNRIVLVTGVSGAGRSTALKSFEDLGYEAVDNLPLTLLESVVLGGPADRPPLAVGVDIRTRDFGVESVISGLDRLLASGKVSVTLLFLDCEDDVLVRRFTETRRRHPLAADRPVADGLRLERRMLADLRKRSDLTIDTSQLSPGALKDEISRRFAIGHQSSLALLITSFSYRYGLPREADLVFDARFLANPHYDPALRDMTGRDKQVGDFIARDDDFATFFDGLAAMLSILLPRFEKEGKSYLTIAVGCTGGRHRSVYVAERLGKMLGSEGRRVHLTHRDIQRNAGQDMR
ncbi:MAG: RNase adapter RapZ [Pseudomonadota bacterium]